MGRLWNLGNRLFSVEHMLKPEQWRGDRPHSKELYLTMAKMAWPSALESILISLIGSIDTIMVGQVGTEAIAAVGITNQPKFILLAVIFSLNVAITAIVARRKGQEDQEGANRCLRQGVLLSAILSAVLSTLGFIFAKPLMVFAGAGADIMNDSVIYFQIITVSLFFTSVGMSINAAQRGAGNTQISMRTNVLANVVNVIFNFLLITGQFGFPRWGVAGAAIATLLGSIASFVMSVCSVIGHKKSFLHVSLRERWWFDKSTLSSIFNISSSAMVEQVFMRIGFFAYAIVVAQLGTIAFATHQICMNIINISFAFGDGLSIAASSLVGQSLGAKREDLAQVYGKIGQRLAMAISTVLFAVFIFGRNMLVALFTTDPQVIALGGTIMIIIAFTTHAQTSQVVFSGCLRGAGDTKFVAIVSLISIGVVRPLITWLLCLPLGFGLIGAWIGLIVDQYTRWICSTSRFHAGKWTKIQI